MDSFSKEKCDLDFFGGKGISGTTVHFTGGQPTFCRYGTAVSARIRALSTSSWMVKAMAICIGGRVQARDAGTMVITAGARLFFLAFLNSYGNKLCVASG